MSQAWAPAGELIGGLHMREDAAYVGIDVGKDKLDVAVGSGGRYGGSPTPRRGLGSC